MPSPEQSRDSSVDFARANEVSAISDLIKTGSDTPVDDLDSGDADDQDELDLQTGEEKTEERSSNSTEKQDDGDVDEDEQTDQQAALEQDEEDSPVTLKDVAESMELDAKDLYEMEIAVGKDETITLGALKDLYKESKGIKAGQAAFEEKKLVQDNEVMVARRQIEQLVEVGVKTESLHPEVLKVLENIHADNISRERKALLRVMPEWSDQAEREGAYDDIADLLGGYGFSRAEVEGVLDHRLLKFARDMARRENQIRKATPKGDGKVPKQTGKGRTKKAVSPLKQRIKAASQKRARPEQKASVISELIRGQ